MKRYSWTKCRERTKKKPTKITEAIVFYVVKFILKSNEFVRIVFFLFAYALEILTIRHTHCTWMGLVEHTQSHRNWQTKSVEQKKHGFISIALEEIQQQKNWIYWISSGIKIISTIRSFFSSHWFLTKFSYLIYCHINSNTFYLVSFYFSRKDL